uniref:4-coumarate--CoA ligase 1-like n=1 Tax=Styela clava TaxID=7725 RepID=UPI00193A3F4D|nr:4-coumarate--CoA ligase 1-like [Styela clava]
MVKHSPYPDLVIPEVPVHEYILKQIAAYGDDIALIDNTKGETLTFNQVSEHVRKLASALNKLGIKKGDIVAICSSNCIEYIVVMLAVSACGGITTTCNPLYSETEILQQLKLSNPNAAFCDLDVYKRLKSVKKYLSTLKNVFTFEETPEITSYAKLVRTDDGQGYPFVQFDPRNDVFLLPYSSGTTGLPKGVVVSHYYTMAQTVINSVSFYQSRSSCQYIVIPMFHVFGYSMALHTISRGSKLVVDKRFHLETMLEAVQRHQVTHVCTVPPIMIALASTHLHTKYNTSSLKRMLTGAAPCAPSLIRTVQDKYNLLITPGYGMTEMVPITLADPLVSRSDSVGTIVPNTEIMVIDPETGKELNAGEDGEILARGPQMMSGYLGNTQATKRTINADGWIHTGDLGHYDEDGMLYVVDRLKELIKYKGFQVAPAELESVLLTHPDIKDAAVIGIPDVLAGELPKAFVVRKSPSLTEEAVIKFVERDLVHYKRLRGGVQFVETIPQSASGKILRRELRKMSIGKSHL